MQTFARDEELSAGAANEVHHKQAQLIRERHANNREFTGRFPAYC
jgi:hypothetical protein